MAEEGILHDGIYRVGDVRVSDLAGRKRLPIGDSVFESVVGNKVYIDKSMLIADVLDSGAVATLFCRPRRFGKSLNLSMLQRFLEIPNPNDIGSGMRSGSSGALRSGRPTGEPIAATARLIP